MRKLAVIASLVALLGIQASSVANERQRGNDAAKSVLQKWGTDQKINAGAMKPLSTEDRMEDMSGAAFDTQVACKATKEFLRLAITPTGNQDISTVLVDMDTDLDGSIDSSSQHNGPYAAVCNNGIIKCDAGTFNNCSYWEWDTNNRQLQPRSVGNQDLSACYCFNNSCGNNLLWSNTTKVLSDIGTGIAKAMAKDHPRLSMADSKVIDTLTMSFYGQEAECGVHKAPEQYYSRPQDIEAAGQAEASQPDTMYLDLVNSPHGQSSQVTSRSCDIERVFDIEYIGMNDIMNQQGGTDRVTVGSCGLNCITLEMGIDSYNPTSGSCGTVDYWADFKINHPDRIQRVTLTNVYKDDWLSVRLNGAALWQQWPSNRCRKANYRGRLYPMQDVTSEFRSVTPGSVARISAHGAFRSNGTAYARFEIRLTPACVMNSEAVNNNCTAEENDAECRLFEENVDGIQTHDNYTSTGLSPVPSAREVKGECSLGYQVRNFWKKDRVYHCQAGSAWNMEAAEERKATIHDSYDPQTGDFSDRRKNSQGNYQTHGENLRLPPLDPVEACTLTCETRRPRAGTSIAEYGDTGTYSNSGPAYDFTVRECEPGPVCPAEMGETVSRACGCESNFGRAASAMSMIRMVAQDTICVP